jgi:hypothetical protein
VERLFGGFSLRGIEVPRDPVQIGERNPFAAGDRQVTRTAVRKKLRIGRIGEEKELLRLPGVQSFSIVTDGKMIAGRRDLFRESRGVARKIECFGGKHG